MTDLVVKRGDTIELAIGPVLKADGTVQDITGHTLRFTAKDRITDLDSAAIIVGSTVDGRITITDAAAGLAEVAIPKTVTDAFTTDRVLVWDVQIADPAGRVRTLDSGKLRVERDVTRTSP